MFMGYHRGGGGILKLQIDQHSVTEASLVIINSLIKGEDLDVIGCLCEIIFILILTTIHLLLIQFTCTK